MTTLTLDTARTIIAAALAKGAKLKLKPLTVAVLDAGGALVALERQDGASRMRPDIAIGKANGAVQMGMGSRALWKRAEEQPYFIQSMNALAGGSGWVIFAYNFHTGEAHNYWAWDHMHTAPMSRPLLALDMYEHSYHMDYGAAAAKYVDAFMLNVNWEEISRRAESALKANLA